MNLQLNNGGAQPGRFHVVLAGLLCVFWLSLLGLVITGHGSFEDVKGILGILVGIVVGWAMPSGGAGATPIR